MIRKLLFIALNICFVQVVFSQSVVWELNETATMDWNRLIILTTGKGKDGSVNPPRSDRIKILDSAKADAVQQLYKAVQELLLDSERTIKNAVAGNTISPLVLRNVVEYYVLMDTRSMSDMSVEVDIEFPVQNHLMALLLPKSMGAGTLSLTDRAHCPTCLEPWPENREIPENTELIVPSEGYVTRSGRPFSGLIIDARGLDLKPALMPRILNSHQEEVYGSGYADYEIAVESGLISYAKDLSTAVLEKRMGADPLVVRAQSVTGTLKADIVISDTDALMIHAAAKKNNFLRACKVMIVVG